MIPTNDWTSCRTPSWLEKPLRDSGLPWIGSIPAHWQVAPLGRVTHLAGGYAFDSSEFSGEGIAVVRMNNLRRGQLDLSDCQRIPSPPRIEGFTLKAGDLLIGMSGSIGETGSLGNFARVAEPDLPALLNQRVGRFVSDEQKLTTDFLEILIQSSLFAGQILLFVTGTAQFNISSEQVESVWITLPPLDEQRAIADYLGRETARLDGLMAAKERVLGLLAEKRRALITRAVTRGLDPHAPLRDSGIPWPDEIPAHWELARLKHFAAIYYGLSQPPDYVPSGIPFLRATNIKRGELTKDGLVFVDEGDLPDSRVVRLYVGDIIVVRSGAYTGDSAIVTEEWGGAVAGYDMVVRILRRAVPEFVSRALLCQYVLEAQIDPLRLRAAQPHLNAEELGDISFALPPLDEQHAIVAHIVAETAKLDALHAATERTIALLKERRAALIAAAVTGRLDVQEAGRHINAVAD